MEENYYLCVSGVAMAVFGIAVCVPASLKFRRKEYGLQLTTKCKVVWLDVGEKQFTELLAGEIALKTPYLKV